MTARKVRADYDALDEIAKCFDREAGNTRRTLNQLHKDLDVLLDGDWAGRGATEFYREMISDVLPAMKRLGDALEQAARTTTRISRIMKQAEDDSARLFSIDWTEYLYSERSRANLAVLVQAKAGEDPGPFEQLVLNFLQWLNSLFSPPSVPDPHVEIITHTPQSDPTSTSPPPTQTATQPPAPTETPTPTQGAAGGTMYVSSPSGANLRPNPGTDKNNTPLSLLNPGTAVEVVGSQVVNKDGYNWIEVRTAEGDTGWIARELLSTEKPATSSLVGAPLQGNVITSGWAYKDKQYYVTADILGTYNAGDIIDPEVYTKLTNEQRALVSITDGSYVATGIFEGPRYLSGWTIDADTYNALSETQKRNAVYQGMHPGGDIWSSDGTIKANADGRIYLYQTWKDESNQWQFQLYDQSNAANNHDSNDLDGFGNYIVMETVVNGETYYQVFGHMAGFDASLTQGQRITAGTVLGTMGKTGWADGPHVHWEIRKGVGNRVTVNEDAHGNVTGYTLTGDFYPDDDVDLNNNFVDPAEFGQWLAQQSTATPSP